MSRRCALFETCGNMADPRCGVVDRDGNAYALCDGCAPDSNWPSVHRVIAKCIAYGTPSPGVGRWWNTEQHYRTENDDASR